MHCSLPETGFAYRLWRARARDAPEECGLARRRPHGPTCRAAPPLKSAIVAVAVRTARAPYFCDRRRARAEQWRITSCRRPAGRQARRNHGVAQFFALALDRPWRAHGPAPGPGRRAQPVKASRVGADCPICLQALHGRDWLRQRRGRRPEKAAPRGSPVMAQSRLEQHRAAARNLGHRSAPSASRRLRNRLHRCRNKCPTCRKLIDDNRAQLAADRHRSAEARHHPLPAARLAKRLLSNPRRIDAARAARARRAAAIRWNGVATSSREAAQRLVRRQQPLARLADRSHMWSDGPAFGRISDANRETLRESMRRIREQLHAERQADINLLVERRCLFTDGITILRESPLVGSVLMQPQDWRRAKDEWRLGGRSDRGFQQRGQARRARGQHAGSAVPAQVQEVVAPQRRPDGQNWLIAEPSFLRTTMAEEAGKARSLGERRMKSWDGAQSGKPRTEGNAAAARPSAPLGQLHESGLLGLPKAGGCVAIAARVQVAGGTTAQLVPLGNKPRRRINAVRARREHAHEHSISPECRRDWTLTSSKPWPRR